MRLERDTGLEPATFALARHCRILPGSSFFFIANTLAPLPLSGLFLRNPDFSPTTIRQTVRYHWHPKTGLTRLERATSDVTGPSWTPPALYLRNEISMLFHTLDLPHLSKRTRFYPHSVSEVSSEGDFYALPLLP
jgi:hypothetical protein